MAYSIFLFAIIAGAAIRFFFSFSSFYSLPVWLSQYLHLGREAADPWREDHTMKGRTLTELLSTLSPR